MQLQKIINTFYQNYPKKLIAISVLLNSAPPIAKPIIKPPAKQKRECLAKNIMKRAKE